MLASLSISSHELNTRFLSHLLYVSASISILTISSPPSYHALADSGATRITVRVDVVDAEDMDHIAGVFKWCLLTPFLTALWRCGQSPIQ